MKDLFTAAIFGSYNGPAIMVEFTDGRPAATYPAALLEDLKRDALTAAIIDAETGELLFYR